MREIRGLQEVRRCENPWGRPPKARGAKALGLRFERNVGKLLPMALHNPWVRFVDNAGVGYCAPDFLLAQGDTLFIVECKLTDWDEAGEKLAKLYRPVFSPLWQGGISCLTVAKNLSPATRRSAVVSSWEDALGRDNAVLHAFGKMPGPKVQLETPKLEDYWSVFALTG